MARMALRQLPLLLMGLVLVMSSAALARKPKPCDVTKPSKDNCLPACTKPCKTEKCLYACHYATSEYIINMSVTPPGGAALPAFYETVAKLDAVLDDNVTLRIDPVGSYKGKVTVADYVATFVHPLGLGSRSAIAKVEITHFANSGHVTALNYNTYYYKVGDPLRNLTMLTGVMWNTFDPVTNKLVKGDWNFLRLPEFQTTLQAPEPRVSTNASAAIIRAVCGVDLQVCKPLGFGGYDNVTDCQSYMSSIPRVAEFGIQGNNQYCRFLHMAYATVDPQHHCPHIGRTGGGACVDQAYADYYKAFPAKTFMGVPSKK